MKLYEEIIFMQQIYNSSGVGFSGRYCIENVIPYYDPLIPGQIVGRHLIWSNFPIPNSQFNSAEQAVIKVSTASTHYGFNISKYDSDKRKDQILKNLVNPEIGLHILNCAFKLKQSKLVID